MFILQLSLFNNLIYVLCYFLLPYVYATKLFYATFCFRTNDNMPRKSTDEPITRFSSDMVQYMLERLSHHEDALSTGTKADSNKKKETAWSALTAEINIRFTALLKHPVQLKQSTVYSKFGTLKSETRTALIKLRKGYVH